MLGCRSGGRTRSSRSPKTFAKDEYKQSWEVDLGFRCNFPIRLLPGEIRNVNYHMLEANRGFL